MTENAIQEVIHVIRSNKQAREQVRQLLLEILGDNSPQTKHSPVLEEVKEFVKENDLCIDPLKFYYHYQATGWQGVTDWQALAYKWSIEDEKVHKIKKQIDWDKETDDWDTPTTRTNKRSYVNWADEPDELR